MSRTIRFRKSKNPLYDGNKISSALSRKEKNNIMKKIGYRYFRKESKNVRRYLYKRFRRISKIMLLKRKVEPIIKKTCGWNSW